MRFCASHIIPPRTPPQFYDRLLSIPIDPFDLLSSLNVLPQVMDQSKDKLTGFCSFRKIVVRDRPEVVPEGDWVIRPDGIAAVPGVEATPRPSHDFLVSRPLNFIVGDQYAACCHIGDLFAYLELAVEIGFLHYTETAPLLSSTRFVQGGIEQGVYPTDFILPLYEKVMALSHEFVARHGKRILGYDSLNRRALPYLAERIESYWLLKELDRRYGQIPEEVFGILLDVELPGHKFEPARATSMP